MKHLIKKIPMIGPFFTWANRNVFKRQNIFNGSESYWVDRYDSNGSSGDGSYGKLAVFKAKIVNEFVKKNDIKTVIEYGCGDGNQLNYGEYPEYLGFDVSPKAIALCSDKFSKDSTKVFKMMADYENESADLTLSLDVIYHLIEDDVYNEYMHRLFGTSRKFVIIYSSNKEGGEQAGHVKHRRFSKWVEVMKPEWELVECIQNMYPFNGDTKNGSLADFYVYRKA